jgi:hypothetical protein
VLKARGVEPEKKPLLGNGSETTFGSRQRHLNKQRKMPVARQQIFNNVNVGLQQ